MIDALPLLLGSDEYQISRSVRIRGSASAFLNRTPSTTTNRRTFVWSGWAKLGALDGALRTLFGSQDNNAASANLFSIYLSSNTLNIAEYASAYRILLASTQVFRDPSAWYHFVVAVDTTQTTSSDRVKIYVNGSQITAFSTATYPAQNTDLFMNVASQPIGIGARLNTAANLYFYDGYLTEVNFIDGYPTGVTQGTWAAFWGTTCPLFGETDIATGVWKPKKYTGTYGTNGFYLNFSDNSAATAATIGKDYSGNGNNFTPNNISVTLGATYDSMLDVPTPWADGGNGRGNYPVMNPLDVAPTESSGRAQILDGNLRLVGANQFARGWLLPSTGQWYWEITLLDTYAGPPNIWGTHGVSSGLYGNVTGVQLWANVNGGIFQDGALVQTFQTWANNDVIGLAYNAATRSMSVYRNGTQLGTSVTANATDKYIYSFMNGTADTSSVAYNFGQRPFSYTPPSGFLALNTQNLPTPTILKGNQFFDATTYTGNGSTQTITNSGGFTPDLVWHKGRSVAYSHSLVDAVRGNSNILISNTTDAESNPGAQLDITTGGFISTYRAANLANNQNAATYVGWQWKEGATQGFDIVTYTGDGTSGRDISHSLGVTPSMIITKARNDTTYSWHTWHTGIGSDYYISLNTTTARDNSVNIFPFAGISSTAFRTATSAIRYNNLNAVTYVAYLFAQVAGFSRFGSYTGNGSTDGPFVFCGFRPRWVMLKYAFGGTAADWLIIDTSRNTFNVMNTTLRANTAAGDESTNPRIDVLSNGFKVRAGSGVEPNQSGATYIFAAFAENPFKYSLAR